MTFKLEFESCDGCVNKPQFEDLKAKLAPIFSTFDIIGAATESMVETNQGMRAMYSEAFVESEDPDSVMRMMEAAEEGTQEAIAIGIGAQFSLGIIAERVNAMKCDDQDVYPKSCPRITEMASMLMSLASEFDNGLDG